MTMNTTTRWLVYTVFLAITLFLVWKTPESDYSSESIVQPVANTTQHVSVNTTPSNSSGVDDGLSAMNPRVQSDQEILVNLFESYQKPTVQLRPKTEPKPRFVSKPTAPPLPFKYIGKLVEGTEIKVFLLEGQALHIVKQGDKLANKYQLKAIDENQLTWIYLPMNMTQKMSI